MELQDLEANALKRSVCAARNKVANGGKSPYHFLVLAKKHFRYNQTNYKSDFENQSEKLPYTAENTVISPNFLVWKFCGKSIRIVSGDSLNLGEITIFCSVTE